MKILLLRFLLFFLIGTTNTNSAEKKIEKQQTEKVAVSIISLISQPKEYQEKRIRVWGYIEIKSNHNILYFHKEDNKYNITKNGLWIDFSQAIKLHKDAYNHTYVMLEGTFNTHYGALGMCSGSLTQVDRIMSWKQINK